MFRLCLIFISIFSIIECSCPPAAILQPCFCVPNISSLTYELLGSEDYQFDRKQNRSIICENLSSLFSLHSIFYRLNAHVVSTADENAMFYDSFLLTNSSYVELPENLFVTIHFRRIMLKNNPFLSSINEKIFSTFENEIEVFESILSNYSNPFSLLRRLKNLRFVGLHLNNIRSIPSRAFNHSFLSRIWFGFEYSPLIESIETIGDFAFTNLPNLDFIRIFSSKLSRIAKYSFSLEEKPIQPKRLLEIHIGSESLHSKSFALTSLTRFRYRNVYLRLYRTNLTYLDENVFQPFLESNFHSSVDLNGENRFLKCVCQFQWIQDDYLKALSMGKTENRVYGYPCWDYEFSRSCSLSTDR